MPATVDSVASGKGRRETDAGPILSEAGLNFLLCMCPGKGSKTSRCGSQIQKSSEDLYLDTKEGVASPLRLK